MKINIEKKVEIKSAIDTAEGKSTTRCLDPDYIPGFIEAAEKKLKALAIPQKAWVGCRVEIRPEAVPNSYKYSANGTYATITRFPSGWFLTDVRRDQTHSKRYGGNRPGRLHLSDGAKEAIPGEFNI